MKKKSLHHQHRRPRATAPKANPRQPVTAQEFDRWVGRVASVAYEGQQTHGAGAVLQTHDRMVYISLDELTIIDPETAAALGALLLGCTPQRFVVMLAGNGPKVLTVVDAPRPLAELHRRWAKTLAPVR